MKFLKCIIDELNSENISGQHDDENFTAVTSTKNFESSEDNIENDATA